MKLSHNSSALKFNDFDSSKKFTLGFCFKDRTTTQMTGYNDFASLICSELVCSCAQTEDSYSNPKVIKFGLSHLSFSNQNLTEPESRIKSAKELSLSQGTAKDTLRRYSGCFEDNLGNIGQHVSSLRTKLHCFSWGFPVSSGLTKIKPESFSGEALDMEEEQSQGGVCVLGTLLLIPD